VHRYAKISGALFTLVALAQFTRVLRRWPAEIGGMAIPMWVSVVAAIITGALAIWAFRISRNAA
jgi:hypothetical protein